MKRSTIALLAFIICAYILPVWAQTTPVPMVVLREGTACVPLRFLAVMSEANVEYNEHTQLITLTHGAHTITLSSGSTVVTIDGITHTLPVAPFEESDTTYVPVRFMGESLDAYVEWVEASQTVNITFQDGQGLPLSVHDAPCLLSAFRLAKITAAPPMPPNVPDVNRGIPGPMAMGSGGPFMVLGNGENGAAPGPMEYGRDGVPGISSGLGGGGSGPSSLILTHPPLIVPGHEPVAEYPKEAAVSGITGIVIITATYDAVGTAISVKQSSGNATLDNAAVRAVVQSVVPASRDGNPVLGTIDIRFNFTGAATVVGEALPSADGAGTGGVTGTPGTPGPPYAMPGEPGTLYTPSTPILPPLSGIGSDGGTPWWGPGGGSSAGSGPGSSGPGIPGGNGTGGGIVSSTSGDAVWGVPSGAGGSPGGPGVPNGPALGGSGNPGVPDLTGPLGAGAGTPAITVPAKIIAAPQRLALSTAVVKEDILHGSAVTLILKVHLNEKGLVTGPLTFVCGPVLNMFTDHARQVLLATTFAPAMAGTTAVASDVYTQFIYHPDGTYEGPTICPAP